MLISLWDCKTCTSSAFDRLNLDFSLGRESFQWKKPSHFKNGFRWSRSVGKLTWYSLIHSELQQIVNELIRLSKRESFPNYSDKSFQSYSHQKSWTLFGFCFLNVEIGYFSVIYVSVGNVNTVKITRHHLITSSNDCPPLTIKIILNPQHDICPPVKHPHWFYWTSFQLSGD